MTFTSVIRQGELGAWLLEITWENGELETHGPFPADVFAEARLTWIRENVATVNPAAQRAAALALGIAAEGPAKP